MIVDNVFIRFDFGLHMKESKDVEKMVQVFIKRQSGVSVEVKLWMNSK